MARLTLAGAANATAGAATIARATPAAPVRDRTATIAASAKPPRKSSAISFTPASASTRIAAPPTASVGVFTAVFVSAHSAWTTTAMITGFTP